MKTKMVVVARWNFIVLDANNNIPTNTLYTIIIEEYSLEYLVE